MTMFAREQQDSGKKAKQVMMALNPFLKTTWRLWRRQQQQHWTHRGIFGMRFWHNNIEVETIFAQLCVRVPSFGALETLPHGVFDLNNWYSRLQLLFKISPGCKSLAVVLSPLPLPSYRWVEDAGTYQNHHHHPDNHCQNVQHNHLYIDLMTNRRFPIGGWANGTPYQADTVLGKYGDRRWLKSER